MERERDEPRDDREENDREGPRGTQRDDCGTTEKGTRGAERRSVSLRAEWSVSETSRGTTETTEREREEQKKESESESLFFVSLTKNRRVSRVFRSFRRSLCALRI